jgi:hypothetical protein
VIVTRSRNGAEQVRQQIAAHVGADRVEVLTADLASHSDLHLLCERFAARHTTLHLLINNAGAHYREQAVNADGVEMHVVVDYLAGFTLTNLLLDRLRAGAPSRVVNVVSAAMVDIRLVKIRRRPRPVPLDPAHLDDLRSELAAVEAAYQVLHPLDAAGRRRALHWLSDALSAEGPLPESAPETVTSAGPAGGDRGRVPGAV